MAAGTALAGIRKIVRSVAKKRFDNARITDVRVREDEDFEGDPILRVTVVFETDEDHLDPDRMVGFIRVLREALEEKASEDRFPIVSYVRSSEFTGARAEAH